MALFNEDEFLGSTVTGATSTRRKNLPPGTYIALIKDLGTRDTVGKPGSKRAGEKFYWLDAELEVQLAGTPAAAELKRDTYRLTHSLGLELTESGALDMSEGANVYLGQLRKALGQNDPSRPWRPRDMVGNLIRIEVTNEPDANDSERVYDRVKNVSGA